MARRGSPDHGVQLNEQSFVRSCYGRQEETMSRRMRRGPMFGGIAQVLGGAAVAAIFHSSQTTVPRTTPPKGLSSPETPRPSVTPLSSPTTVDHADCIDPEHREAGFIAC